MNKETHIVFSIAFSIAILDSVSGGIKADHIIPIVVFSVIGSRFPDLDLRYKHRVLLHNIIAAFTFSFILYLALSIILSRVEYALSDLVKISTTSFFLGYSSHLILDALTIKGIAILYPVSHRRYRLTDFKSTSRVLNTLIITLSAIILLLVLVT